jgi:hypothetical protein
VALRLAGAFFVAFLVDFFAGGTVTTFLGELSLGEVRTSRHSEREGVRPHALHGQGLSCFLKSDPTVNFTDFEAGI